MTGSRVFAASSTDEILISDSASLQTLYPSFTLACWVKTNPGIGTVGFAAAMILGPDLIDSGLNLSGGPDDSSMALFSSVGAATSGALSQSVETVPVGVWTHVAMTYNDVTDRVIHFYINGVETTYAVQSAALGVESSWSGASVGNDGFGDPFIGSIAESRFYNAALSSAQIAAIAADTTGSVNAGGVGANLEAYLHICGLTSPEPDSSGNGNTGAVTGTTIGLASPGYSGCVLSNYSVPDCRNFFIFPNASRTVNDTKIYDVQTSSNPDVPGTDSRAAGAPVASGTYPQNSRTPGTYGPGE